jgi:hypothetical protein
MDLNEFFKMQGMLNKYVKFDDEKFRAAFSDCSPKRLLGVINYDECLLEAGAWIDDFLKAMNSEIEELRDCTFWKHWCSEAQGGERYKIKNVETARKEVIDMLHFWISLAQALGMTGDMVSDMYRKKLMKNIQRQVQGYSITEKEIAWQLYQGDVSQNQSGNNWPAADSLEDLSEMMQLHYLDKARNKITERENCYCHRCNKWFHYLGIARHRRMHIEKRQSYKITYTHGDIGKRSFCEQCGKEIDANLSTECCETCCDSAECDGCK